jgi:hypothetical protein
MADATLATMRNRTLQKLLALVAGEVANAEDAALIDGVIANCNEDLREREICYWSDDATPLALVETLAAYYACHIANDYFEPTQARAFRTDHMESSMRRLRELTATRKRVDTPTRATFF